VAAFRDETDALRARVETLERELERRPEVDEIARELGAIRDCLYAHRLDAARDRLRALHARLAGEPEPKTPAVRRRAMLLGAGAAAGLIACAGLALAIVLTRGNDHEDARCPPGATLEELGDGAYRCTFGPFSTPHSDQIEPYCDYLERGYFGFTWPLAHDRHTSCPSGMRWSDNGEGLAFCTARRGPVAPGYHAEAECDRVQDGLVGYVVRRRR